MIVKHEVKMLEGSVKALMLEYLRNKNQLSKDDTIISEFPIKRSSRRADIVLIGKSTHAFEIKSEADTLNRLQGQMEAYLDYFDKVTVVTASKHINQVKKITPACVGIWEVRGKSIYIIRRGIKVPVTDRGNLIQLMRVHDLAKTIRVIGHEIKSMLRSDLVLVANSLSISQLRKAAINALKMRYAKTNSDFWNCVGQSVINLEHLALLSPASKEREVQLEREKMQSDSWAMWIKKAQELPDDIYLHHLMKTTQPKLFGPIPDKIKKMVNR